MESIPSNTEIGAEKLKEISDRAKVFFDESKAFDTLLEEREREGLKSIFEIGDYSLNTLVNNLATVVEQDVLSKSDLDAIYPALKGFDFSIDRVGLSRDDRPDDMDSLERLKVQCGTFANACYDLSVSMENSQAEMFNDILPVLKNMIPGLDKVTMFIQQRADALDDYLNTR